jgi:hypothetical protein
MEDQHQPRVEQLADINTIGAGAAAEKFAAELQAVLENIRDLNTQPDAKRKIVMEWVFEPDEDRERVLVAITAVFAATKPSGEVMYVGSKGGETVATVLPRNEDGADPRQGILDIKTGKAGSS